MRHNFAFSFLPFGFGACKYHTSNGAEIRCKTCEKMATGKSWMNYYSMTTMRIGYEIKKPEKWNYVQVGNTA